MRQKSGLEKQPAEEAIKDIRRATRRHFSAEDKIRIVLEGLRGEDSIAELCGREGIVQNLYYRIHPVGAAGMALSELTAPPRQAARATGIALRQFQGSSAARSVILWSAIRASTSASQVWGSMLLSLAV